MRIFSSPISPFGERVSIAARAKGIPLERAKLPDGGLQSAEYLAINPIGKIPVLVADSGSVIPESVAILNYLEDRFPTPSLRPADPEQRARMNVAICIMDTYVMASVIRTFPHLDATTRDPRIVADEVGRWRAGLAALGHFMALPMPEADAGVTLADCVLAPSLHLSERIAEKLGIGEDLLSPHRKLAEYYAQMNEHVLVGPVLDELTRAQAAYDAAQAST